MADINKEINDKVVTVIEAEKGLTIALSTLEEELQADPKFQLFLKAQSDLREAQAKSTDVWKNIESQMIEHNIKSIKGDWGSITIVERLNWETNPDLLPSKFIKKVVDTTKLSNTFKLEGKDPKGATHYYTKYLMKKIK